MPVYVKYRDVLQAWMAGADLQVLPTDGRVLKFDFACERDRPGAG